MRQIRCSGSSPKDGWAVLVFPASQNRWNGWFGCWGGAGAARRPLFFFAQLLFRHRLHHLLHHHLLELLHALVFGVAGGHFK